MTYGLRVAGAVAAGFAGTLALALTKLTLNLSFRDVAWFSVTIFVSYFVAFAWIAKPRKYTFGRLILTGLFLAAVGSAVLVLSKFLARGLSLL